jgi:phospholipase A1/A2
VARTIGLRRPGLGLAALLLAHAAMAETPADCAQKTDDPARLACYDRLFRAAPVQIAPHATPGTPAPPVTPGSPPAATADTAAREQADPELASTLLTKWWELTPAAKRGTFVVRTYQPNFVLPLHWSSSINQAPSTPTRGVAEGLPAYRPVDAKLQISLRAKVAEGLLLPDADLWFAYTQRSFWQVWNPQQSSPFRNTDYQPEAIYVVPVPKAWSALPGGWQWRMAQLGIVHQSNGQSGALSRSWNRVYAATTVTRGQFGLALRMQQRLGEKTDDDNPDIVHYLGNTELVASWLPGLATASVTWRTHALTGQRGSLQLDWTYPVLRSQPSGLRWYAQLFSGYGETLLDYDHRQTSLGLGLTLFQF